MTEISNARSRIESFLIGTGGTLSWYCVEQTSKPPTPDDNEVTRTAAEYVPCGPAGITFMFSGTGGSREWWRDLLPKHAASVADQLRFVKRQLGLSLTDLARVCSASRPTIYSWLDGQDPSVSNRRRIARLYALALRCEAAFKQALPTKLVLPDGKTSVDVLSEFDSDIDEMLSTFRDAMPSSAEQRRDVPQSATRINADRVDAIDKFFRTAGDISRR